MFDFLLKFSFIINYKGPTYPSCGKAIEARAEDTRLHKAIYVGWFHRTAHINMDINVSHEIISVKLKRISLIKGIESFEKYFTLCQKYFEKYCLIVILHLRQFFLYNKAILF